MSIDFNFVGPKFDLHVDKILFGETDHLSSLWADDKTLAHLMHNIGAFPSVKEAKRNGWDKPIPSGWNEYKLPKKFNGGKMYIWNPTTIQAEFDAIEDDK